MEIDYTWLDTIRLPKLIYINRNTSLIREKLEILGYLPLKELPWTEDFFGGLLIFKDDQEYCGFDKEDLYNARVHYIDCGNNESMFCALAALREDTDIHQWFISEEADPQWFLSGSDICEKRLISSVRWRKATPGEIIVHFRNE